MEIIKDINDWGVTVGKAKKIVADILSEFPVDSLQQDAVIQSSINTAYDSQGNEVGYYLSFFIVSEIAEAYYPELSDNIFGIKTATGYFRVFKTIEAAVNTAKELGFSKCHIWMTE